MLIVITGGSGSGKSVYAENLAVKLQEKGLYYIATMKPYDTECLNRIKRHRLQRAKKGFTTIECYKGLETVSIEGDSVVLLECMSNLLANEMFLEVTVKEKEEACKKRSRDILVKHILRGIDHLIEGCEHLIIVTNEVFSDNGSEFKETMDYIKILGTINQRLAEKADRVYEVVCGIPVLQKGKE